MVGTTNDQWLRCGRCGCAGRPASPERAGGDAEALYLATVDWAMSIPSFILAINAWRTPKRVVAADGPDQIADLGRDRRPAGAATGLQRQSQAEATPMPASQRLGLENDRSSEQRREQPVQPDKDQPICDAQPEPGWRGPLQHKQLLAENSAIPSLCIGQQKNLRRPEVVWKKSGPVGLDCESAKLDQSRCREPANRESFRRQPRFAGPGDATATAPLIWSGSPLARRPVRRRDACQAHRVAGQRHSGGRQDRLTGGK